MKNLLSTAACLLLGIFVLTGTSFSAGESETPTTLKACKVITAEEAKKLHDQKVTFIDTRNPMNFGKGHIPGAVLIPYSGKSENKPDFDDSKDQFDLSSLRDKNTKIVVYGHGPTGWKAYKAAVKAAKTGYKNVLWFRGGLEDWEKKGFPKE